MPRGAPVGRFGLPATLLVVVLLAAASIGASPARGAGAPPLPLALDRIFVNNMTGAELAPGSGGAISMKVGNPLADAMTGTVLTVGVYAFNAFPGNATSGVNVASAPVLSNVTSSGLEVNESLGSLATHATTSLSISVQTADSTPAGTFAIRTALRFVENGTAYVLESRGWFTFATWTAATNGPNGSTDVNLSRLGVSGILPETSLLVQSNNFAYALWAVLGVGLVVVGIGAWLYFRRSNSKSGTRPVPAETQAPRAFGTRRTSDGD
ncbi:MAG TPA: hypothetical protein VK424_05720 [Thermoplasmata archaeon]|nr:hypothetical protein [Thermoplasmata archaeon]